MKKRFFFLLLIFFPQFSAFASPLIRVALLIHLHGLSVACPEGLEVQLPGGEKVFAGSVANFETSRNQILLNGRPLPSESVLVKASAPFLLDKRTYRGILNVRLEGDYLDAINLVDLEKYLYSVVGSEMPSKWPLEALKAQAVVARTYALKKIEERGSFPFDLVATAKDQVYNGTEDETVSTRNAADSTKGEILTYDGDLIMAYYHADCGGRTENGESVFKGNFPYLKSVVCPFGKYSPYQYWEKTFTLSEISRLVGTKVTNLLVSEDSSTEHVSTVTIETGQGPLVLAGHFFRRLLGVREIRSTRFAINILQRIVYVPKIRNLSFKKIVEYAEARVARTVSMQEVKEISPSNSYVIYGTGALSSAAFSEKNPFVVVSDNGILSTIYRKLSAISLKTKIVFSKILYPKTVQTEKKKLTWVGVKVPAAFTFFGSGWGHGVGMCQWGARGMASLGKGYAEILHYYYTDVKLEKFKE